MAVNVLIIVLCILLCLVLIVVKILLDKFFTISEKDIDLKEIQKDFINDVINDAVRYAEQTVKGTGKGIEKKEVATQFVQKIFDKFDIQIDATQLSTFIELAVYSMNNPD